MRIIQPTSPDDHRRALVVLLSRPDSPREQIEAQVDTLCTYARTYGLSLENCLVAAEDDRPLAASLCVDSPGRIASVFLPAALESPRAREACRMLLGQVAKHAVLRGLKLLQAMLEPDHAVEAEILQECDFSRVARLLCLERDLAVPLPPDSGRALTWESYSEALHDEFIRILKGTYEASLDCPVLNGRRSVEDVLATHRAAGRCDPRIWTLARDQGEAVGLVLVNEFPERHASEVVYMGVLTKFRQCGYGSALLRRAVLLARRLGSMTLALSVDEDNLPARRLYASFGFQETAKRDAWIRFLDGPRCPSALHA